MILVFEDAAGGHPPLKPAAAAGSTPPGAVVMVTVMIEYLFRFSQASEQKRLQRMRVVGGW